MKRTILLMLPILLLAGCGEVPPAPDPGPTPPPEPLPGEIRYEYTPSLRRETSTKTDKYLCSYFYKEEYFKADAKVFNKDLALLSCGKSMMAASEDDIKSFYSQAEFDNVETHFVSVKTENTVSYAFAHIKIENFDLVSLVVSGHNYGLEWANNALVGLTGDHEGFSLRANDIYNSLKTYLASYENYKLWISGYSRGGAISNVLSHYILSREEISITKENMFVYTFECPKGLLEENAPKYENVFNVLYSGDFVTYVSPSEFGFARCGIDVDLYTSSNDLDDKLYAFDRDIDMPKFKPYKDFNDDSKTVQTEQEGVQSLLTYALRDGTDGDLAIYFHTREDYVNKVQHAFETALSIFFGLPTDVIDQIITQGKAQIFTILQSAQAMCDFLIPFLDQAGYVYDKDVLLQDCTVIYKLANANLTLVAKVFAAGDIRNAVTRSIKVHFPEVGYILLKDLCNSSK